MKICVYETCDRELSCINKYCLAHYKQFTRTGQLWPLGTRKPGQKVIKFCDTTGCDREFYALGKCVSHWARIRDGYDPEAPIKGQVGFWRPCAVPDCEREASYRFKTCFQHRDRARRYGMSENLLIEFWGNGECEACSSKVNLAIHHDHGCCPGIRSCGKCVVALLCAMCNRAAGMLNDDPEKLRRLADVIDLTSANRNSRRTESQ